MSNWESNAIQFPRLLAEIMATQENLDIPALAESMDLTIDEVGELFDRAHEAWEVTKAGSRAAINLQVNCFDQYANVTGTRMTTLTLEQITDIVDHATQLIFVQRSDRRSSGDINGPLDELEEAIAVTGLLDTVEF
jgi:hypothetical protein